MTKTVSFQTPRGAIVEIRLVTQRENLADHTYTVDCWAIEYRLNGNLTFGKRIDHAQAGAAIELDMGTRSEGKKVIAQSAVAQIPPDKVAEVDAIIAEYEAGARARVDASIAAEMSEAVQFSRRLSANMDRADSNN